MLLTKHFVFAHFLKSGGTFVKQTLRTRAPASWQCVSLEGHPALKDIPSAYLDLPRFGFVRNPWDWYVSIYYYFTYVAKDSLFDSISKGRTLGFSDTISRAFLAEPFVSQRMTPLGYYFNSVYTPGYACELLRFEELRMELSRYLVSLDLRVPEEVLNAVRTGSEINPSPRREYRAYYTPDLAQEIKGRDAQYIERFEYKF